MNKNFRQEIIWVLCGKAIALVGSLLLIKLLTNILDIETYAQLVLGLTIHNLLNQVIIGPIGQGIGRIYIEAVEGRNLSAFVAEIFRLNKVVVSVYILAIIFIAIISEKIEFESSKIFLIIIVIYSYISGLNDISTGLHNLARNRAASAIGVSLEVTLKIGLIYVLSLTITNLSTMHILTAFLGSACIILIYHRKIFDKLRIGNNQNSDRLQDWRSEIQKIYIPASIWGLFVWMQQVSDRWALQYFQGAESVSQYWIIYQIGYAPLVSFMSVIMTYSMPFLYSRNEKNALMLPSLTVIFITLISFFVTLNFSTEILEIIASTDFLAFHSTLPLMVVAAGLYQLGDIFATGLMREKKIRKIMLIKIITAVLCSISNAIGANAGGVSGVIISMLLFGVLYSAAFWASFTFMSRRK